MSRVKVVTQRLSSLAVPQYMQLFSFVQWYVSLFALMGPMWEFIYSVRCKASPKGIWTKCRFCGCFALPWQHKSKVFPFERNSPCVLMVWCCNAVGHKSGPSRRYTCVGLLVSPAVVTSSFYIISDHPDDSRLLSVNPRPSVFNPLKTKRRLLYLTL